MVTRVKGLGEYLIDQGLITSDQLESTLDQQRRTKVRLGEILIERGFIDEWDLLGVLSRQLGHEIYDENVDDVRRDALELIPLEFARRHNIIPIRRDDQYFVVAMHDPLDVEALDNLQRIAARIDRDLAIRLATSKVLETLRETHYGAIQGDRKVNTLIESVIDEIGDNLSLMNEEDPEASAQDASIINLVDQIIGKAIIERATDIHIEPQAETLLIRYRVDGILHDALTPPAAVKIGVTSRLKIMANMDIAERRAAQDGRFTFSAGVREVDVRVSIVPTVHGEKVVMRLLDKTNFNYTLCDLGFSADDLKAFQTAIHRPHGMVLLSGPTGSGKTTTLYSGLRELDGETINITTVEDPVEYQIARINQVQVNRRKDLTFATALRSFLRQDPDVIMVGEIRDQETAEIAVRAALTGHMVFSTIHANDAPSTAVRLVSMGVEPFMAASALTLVAAQRLVRRNCAHCLESYAPSEETLMALGLAADDTGGDQPFRRGAGCGACSGRGYSGRVAVVEKMVLSPRLRNLISERRSADEIRTAAREEGMRSLMASGIDKARAGTTTLEEVLRICLSD